MANTKNKVYSNNSIKYRTFFKGCVFVFLFGFTLSCNNANKSSGNSSDSSGDNNAGASVPCTVAKPYTTLRVQNVVNGDFEAGATNWLPYQSSTVAASGVNNGGAGGAAVTNRATQWGGIYQNVTASVQEGVSYELTADIKLDPAEVTSHQMNFILTIVDASGTKYKSIDTMTISGNDGWQTFYGTYTYTFNEPVQKVELLVNSSDTGFDFYVDNLSIEDPVEYCTENTDPLNIIRASGRDLVVTAANTPIILKGINFTAYSDDPADPVQDIMNSKNFNEASYADVKAMKMNVVRLNMDARYFEDNSNPYYYKQSGWNWLEKNIIWAKKNGLYLILDMHSPQGGYQSWDNNANANFWTVGSKNQKRLTALWVAIANRYKDEDTIAGYDLINEPGTPTSAAWNVLSQKMIDAIRVVDANHLIIMESGLITGGVDFIFTVLDDANVMYDSHHYPYWSYCIQLLAVYGNLDYTDGVQTTYGNYPDTSALINTRNGADFDSAYLEAELLFYGLQFGIDNNVPMNVGEYGLSYKLFNPFSTKGGLTWVADFNTLMDTHKLNRQYYNYHNSAFGIYYSSGGANFPDPLFKNTTLSDWFIANY
ncbi:MAG: cellulase family glycosylhydrolase [Leptospirales bacterium]